MSFDEADEPIHLCRCGDCRRRRTFEIAFYGLAIATMGVFLALGAVRLRHQLRSPAPAE